MDEKQQKLTAQDIEALKAAKTLNKYCTAVTCSNCVFYCNYTTPDGFACFGCALEDGICPDEWPINTMTPAKMP